MNQAIEEYQIDKTELDERELTRRKQLGLFLDNVIRTMAANDPIMKLLKNAYQEFKPRNMSDVSLDRASIERELEKLIRIYPSVSEYFAIIYNKVQSKTCAPCPYNSECPQYQAYLKQSH